MNSRGARLVVLALAIVAGGAVGYFLFTSERSIAARSASFEVFDREAGAARLALAEFRSAQHAYVADGQGPEFWMARADDRLRATDGATRSARDAAAAEGTAPLLDAVLGQLTELSRLDARARQYVRGDQRLMASDVIFADAGKILATIIDRLGAAREGEATAFRTASGEQRRYQAIALAGAAALWLLALVLLVPRGVAAAPAEPVADLSSEAGTPADAGPVLSAADGLAGTRSNPVPSPPAAASSLASAAGNSPDLGEAARLCSDLARVVDSADLSSLIGRAAGLVGASGAIVWVADRAGKELFPLITHGYSPNLVARLGTIGRDADNATAAAYREGEFRTVSGEGPVPGAIAAPIVTAEGCVGVFTAEVTGGQEREGATRALASLVAAQLATLVRPVEGPQA